MVVWAEKKAGKSIFSALLFFGSFLCDMVSSMLTDRMENSHGITWHIHELCVCCIQCMPIWYCTMHLVCTTCSRKYCERNFSMEFGFLELNLYALLLFLLFLLLLFSKLVQRLADYISLAFAFSRDFESISFRSQWRMNNGALRACVFAVFAEEHSVRPEKRSEWPKP